MCSAPAIRRAESRDRKGSSLERTNHARPVMLATDLAQGIPDALEPRVRAQVIDVPVRPPRYPPVVRDASTYPSRPEGAAHIYVEAASKLEGAEFPDSDQLASGTKEDQCVSAGSWFHDRAPRPPAEAYLTP
ncbi:hypothetical protein SBA2_210009 [Acidobacteriia bacterium SbA2]|nr:hypothetical protein SBA2_210009 [Acidobacteriia bacterium SbA2]